MKTSFRRGFFFTDAGETGKIRDDFQKRGQTMQKKNNDYGNRKFSYSIRALAGVYLLYLTYDAVTGAGEKTGPVLLFALLFALCGVLLIVNGTMGLSRLEKQSREALRKQQEAEAQEVATQKEAEPQQPEATADQPGSIAERLKAAEERKALGPEAGEE